MKSQPPLIIPRLHPPSLPPARHLLPPLSLPSILLGLCIQAPPLTFSLIPPPTPQLSYSFLGSNSTYTPRNHVLLTLPPTISSHFYLFCSDPLCPRLAPFIPFILQPNPLLPDPRLSLFPHTSLSVMPVSGGFSPREHSAMSGGLSCPLWGREGAATGLWRVEARDARKHPPCTQDWPTVKSYPAPDVRRAEAEEPRCKLLEETGLPCLAAPAE